VAFLTNFQTISERTKRLGDLERYEAEGQLALAPNAGERMAAEADLAKLSRQPRRRQGHEGHAERDLHPSTSKTETIAVREAQRLRIPIIGLVDNQTANPTGSTKDPRQRTTANPLVHDHREGDR